MLCVVVFYDIYVIVVMLQFCSCCHVAVVSIATAVVLSNFYCCCIVVAVLFLLWCCLHSKIAVVSLPKNFVTVCYFCRSDVAIVILTF